MLIEKVILSIARMVYRFSPPPLKQQLDNFRILAVRYGQYQSILQRECIDCEGKKIPWYTYPAIEYLNGIDFSQKLVFEYGSGNSSAYWAKKAMSVISVEHSSEWYSKVKSEMAENQVVELCETEAQYLDAIDKIQEKIDVIIIDGKYREKCVKLVKDHISDDGIVILDNSDWFTDTSKYLRDELDLLEVDFHGFGPINNYTWTTSIFYKRGARLKPIGNVQPQYSISAIKNGVYEKFVD